MENPFELILERLNTIENLLRTTKRNDPTPSVPVNEILNMSQAADYLGLAKSTIYKLTSSRLIPHCKIGNKIAFKRSDLNEWITKGKVKTREEIEQEANDYIVKRKRY